MKKYKFNFDQKTKPFSHQTDAIEFVAKNQYIPLFDEQGLGKTKIVIEALCRNMEENVLDGALIICKKSLIETWKEEIELHTHLKYIVLRGSPNEKGMKFMGYSHFYIINYESVISEAQRLRMFLKIRKMAIVLDESHNIKNPNATTTKSIFEIKDFAKKRIIITGSPVANKPVDLWSQFYFLDDGVLLGKDFKEFQKRFAVDLRSQDGTAQERKVDELRKIISSNSIRRLKKDVLELPEKIYYEKYVKLAGAQKKLYDTLKEELYIEITNMEGEKIIDKSDEILKKILRLVQIASNPFLVDKSYNEIPAKFLLLDSLVEEILKRDEKIVIWSAFVDNIRVLYNRYKKFGSLMLYGDIPIEKRKDIVAVFKKDNEAKILIANPAAAREGLTLTSANNAIYLDRSFSLVDYLQSQDRIHRISQTKKCHIYKIMCLDTIDVYVEEIIYRKQKIAEYIQGDIDKIQTEQCLTKEEILRILGGSKHE